MAPQVSRDALAEREPPRRYQPLVLVALAVVAGVLGDCALRWPPGVWWSLGCLAAIGSWAAARHRGRAAESNRTAGSIAGAREAAATFLLLVGFAALGGAWHQWHWQWHAANDLGCFAGETDRPVAFRAVVLDGPRQFDAPPFDPLRTMPAGERTEFHVRPVAARREREWIAATGRVRLVVASRPEELPENEAFLASLKPGDAIIVMGRLQLPHAAMNPDEFDLRRHRRAERLLCQVAAGFPECVAIERPANFWRPLALWGNFRERCRVVLERHIAPERQALAAALVLGRREQVPQEQIDAFFLTGTIHLLAISGLHVAILAVGLDVFFRCLLLPRGGRLLAVVLTVLFYTLLTGGQPPVTRAAVLITVACAGAAAFRRPPGWNTLAAAALVVLAMNPSDLFRIGAQLSFLAVAAILLIAPWLRSLSFADGNEALPEPWRPAYWGRKLLGFLRDSCALSVAIWFFMLPFVLWLFHLVNPAGLLLNVFLCVPVALALGSGFAAMLLGFLPGPLAGWCGWACDFNLWLLAETVAWGERLPGAYFWLPSPAAWWVLGYYVLLTVVAVCVPARRRMTLLALAAAAWLCLGASWLALPNAWKYGGERVRATFVSVGHGTSVVIELPDGRAMLYDAGALGVPEIAARKIAAVLWSRGRRHLDAAIISHADADHYNALPALLEKFSVGRVYVSPVMFERDAAGLKALREAIELRGVEIVTLHGGARLDLGSGAACDVLHPPPRGIIGSDNANSIVLAISYRGERLLLPGDLESPGLEDVLAEDPLPCSAAMAPHHGSSRSNPRGFAEWCKPKWIVISGGERSDAEQVERAFADAGCRVLHTARHGAITVELRTGETRVKPFLAP